MLNRIKSVGEYLFRVFVQIDQTNFLKHTWARLVWFYIQVLHSFGKEAMKYFVTQMERIVIGKLAFSLVLVWFFFPEMNNVPRCSVTLLQNINKCLHMIKRIYPVQRHLQKKLLCLCFKHLKTNFLFLLLVRSVLCSSVCCIQLCM